ncbi:hypothetical protein ACLOJK_014140 [Asimina triloba]
MITMNRITSGALKGTLCRSSDNILITKMPLSSWGITHMAQLFPLKFERNGWWCWRGLLAVPKSKRARQCIQIILAPLCRSTQSVLPRGRIAIAGCACRGKSVSEGKAIDI